MVQNRGIDMKSVFLATAACGMVCFAADIPKPEYKVIDQIIAKVNGDIVSQDEIQKVSREAMAEAKAQGIQGPQAEQIIADKQKNALRDRIDELLLIEKGKELSVNVDSEVSKYMASLQRQSGITDPEKFHDYVRQQSGMSFEDFQAEAKNQALTREVIGQEVGRHISVTDKEIQAYYEAHKTDFVREEKVFLSEILVSTEKKDEAGIAAAKKKADTLSEQAKRGDRFSDLARNNSDAATAKEGGALGGYKKGELNKDIESAVWDLKKGGVTAPIKIATGYEIFKVEDHSKAGLAPLVDVRSEIENVLYGPKMQPKVREYLTSLRTQAFLQIKPGFTDTGAAQGQDTKWQDPAVLKPETVTKREVEEKKRHKKFLGIPIPGTSTTDTGKSSSR
jgi:peptidyl-prolyl cis-trans isomerase SurA